MKIKGRIRKILPKRSGVSQRTGNQWEAQPFIFEYFNEPSDIYTSSILIETMSQEVIAKLEESQEVVIDIKFATREYEGRYYNDVRLVGFEVVDKDAQKGGRQGTQKGGQGAQQGTQQGAQEGQQGAQAANQGAQAAETTAGGRQTAAAPNEAQNGANEAQQGDDDLPF